MVPWVVITVQLDFPQHLYLGYPPHPPAFPEGLVTQTRIIDGKMFVSFQELVHDRGVVCHRGVICIHCRQADD